MADPTLSHQPENVASEDGSDALWRFSVALYDRPGVAASCLRLQDSVGLDVPMLLFCLWAGHAGPGALASGDLARVLSVARSWGEGITSPLRAARRALKDDALGAAAARLSLREAVIDAERRAERLALGRMAALAETFTPGPRGINAARANLDGYCTAAGCEPADVQADMALLLRAAFADN